MLLKEKRTIFSSNNIDPKEHVFDLK